MFLTVGFPYGLKLAYLSTKALALAAALALDSLIPPK